MIHGTNRNLQLSIKHLKLSASAGNKESLDTLMTAYKDKLLSKEDLTQTLRAFQAASNEMNNKDRDDARAWWALKSGRQG